MARNASSLLKASAEQDVGDAELNLGRLTRYLGYPLRRAQLAVFDDFVRTLAEVQLRPGQFVLLAVIESNPGLTPSRICAALEIKPANLGLVLQRFEDRGLLRRVPLNRRSSGIHLTARGRALIRKADKLGQRHNDRVLALLGSDDVDVITKALYRLAGLSDANRGVGADS